MRPLLALLGRLLGPGPVLSKRVRRAFSDLVAAQADDNANLRDSIEIVSGRRPPNRFAETFSGLAAEGDRLRAGLARAFRDRNHPGDERAAAEVERGEWP